MPRVTAQAAQIGVLVGIGELLIFEHFLPPVTDVKTASPYNPHIESSERTALLLGIGFAVLVASYVRSFDTFVVAGAILAAADFAYKHANAVNPNTGKMQPTNSPGLDTGGNDNAYPMADYSGSEEAA